MKRAVTIVLLVISMWVLCACGSKQLVNMTTQESAEGYTAIIWEDRTYVPFCVVSKSLRCGEQIGFLDGNRDDRVYIFKGYSSEDWVVNSLKNDGGAILYKELNVTDIPDGLESEYDWN